MSDIEPAKLKVTELRDELKKRGLDTKGNKPQLVKRLEKALAAEAGEAPIADISEADLSQTTDTSLNESTQADTSLHESATQPDALHDESQSLAVAAEQPVTEVAEPATAQVAEVEPEVAPAVSDESAVVASTAEAPVVAEEPVNTAAIIEEPPAPGIEDEPLQQVVEDKVKAEPEPSVEEIIPAAKEPAVEMSVEPMQEVKPEEIEEPVTEAVKTEEPEASADVQTSEEMEVAPVEAKSERGEAETKEDAEPEVIKIDDAGAETGMDVKDSESGDHKDDADKHRERRKRSRSPSDDKHRSHRSRSRSPRRSRRSRSRSHSNERRRHERRSRSRSHERRQKSRSPEKVEQAMDSEDWLSSTAVQLDRYHSDLSLCIDETGYKAQPLTSDAFGFMWTGVKAMYGVKQGKVCFEMKVVEHLNVDHLPPEEDNRHVTRVGFSASSASLLLGEEKLSFGYGGTGKASTECKFRDYGVPFAQDDVITAYVDLSSDPVIISFAKNGDDLGTCFEVEASKLDGQALFPHVLTKNCSFECNFGQMESPFFPTKEGFVFINDVPVEERERGILPPTKKKKVPTAILR